jgi:hypothetical protein
LPINALGAVPKGENAGKINVSSAGGIRREKKRPMRPYAFTIFLSAFLLFSVQLLLAKYILPWFGGAPAVWTTCMLFFQSLLLAGYGYAHWLSGRPIARQRNIHLVLLAASAALLAAAAFAWGAPLLPDGSWRPAPGATPAWQIVQLLAVGVGLPYFALSATGPLLQAWFNRAHPHLSPYRLYALSNLGSLLGLVSYPFAVEAYVPLKAQAQLWSTGYVTFVAGMAACALLLVRRAQASAAAVTTPVNAEHDTEASRPGAVRYLLWFALPMCASVLLLAVTNQLTQEVAAIPFLWMLPLSLYLLSFILCFDGERWYARGIYLTLLLPALALTTIVIHRGLDVPLLAQIGVYVGALFVLCMMCHGELVRLRPHPRHLTSFYLTITAGGAAGGLFVGLAAPYLFVGYWELPIGLWLCAALALAVLLHDRDSPLRRGSTAPALAAAVAAVVLAGFVFGDEIPEGIADNLELAPSLWTLGLPAAGAVVLVVLAARRWLRTPVLAAGSMDATLLRITGLSRERANATQPRPPASDGPTSQRRLAAGVTTIVAALGLFGAVHMSIAHSSVEDTTYVSRNFYGVLQVVENDADDPVEHNYRLRHGRIIHGVQYDAPDKRREPSAYYGPQTGISLAVLNHPKRLAGRRGLRLGVIGLGVGTLAAYGRRGDTVRFYEINPQVIRLARGEDSPFSYLGDTRARVEIALGDARLSLEQELARGARQNFDVLAVDAFSSDSIPVHLLTREALGTYLAHLNPRDGILAIHVSNRYLELTPVVRRLAEHFGLDMAVVESDEVGITWRSTWVLLAHRHRTLAAPAIARAALQKLDPPASRLWTDDYSNLFRALRIGEAKDPGSPAQAGKRPTTAILLDVLEAPRETE